MVTVTAQADIWSADLPIRSTADLRGIATPPRCHAATAAILPGVLLQLGRSAPLAMGGSRKRNHSPRHRRWPAIFRLVLAQYHGRHRTPDHHCRNHGSRSRMASNWWPSATARLILLPAR